jgi:aldehyde dehydrogenase (NAD+)
MTPVDPNKLAMQRAYFQKGNTRSSQSRKEALEKLRDAIKAHEQQIFDALEADLGKGPFEAYTSEIGFVLQEIRHATKHLRKWMRRSRVPTTMVSQPAKSYIERVPKGLVLVISPWNYPFQLLMAPLVAAIAAGNVIVLKPSELSPRTSAVIESVITSVFDPEFISVYQGDGREIIPALFDAVDFDHVFFTGSVDVGRIISTMAAERHTPVTLELGGKSPAIVHRDAEIREAARRVMYGKTMNSGQVCIAPDYLLVHADVRQQFVDAAIEALREFFPDGALAADYYGRMVNESHFSRVAGYLDQGTVLCGGATDPEKLQIEPTLLADLPAGASALQEEIFGPVLPIISYSNDDELISALRKRANPLALYLFSTSDAFIKRVTDAVPFGGGCINDTILHIISPNLPFGGVRSSGQGSYHGKFGFDAMTHARGMVRSPARFSLPLRYPPYSRKALSLVRKVLS